MNILVTGGAGYIGSHTIIELINDGHSIVAVDNLSNSNGKAIVGVNEITNQNVPLIKADTRDRFALEKVFEDNDFDCVIHFAGLKSVGESVLKPWEYYDNNVNGTLILLDEMRKHNIRNFIFSSSATVYGVPKVLPISEKCSKGVCTNPYGKTKSMIEEILKDMYAASLRDNTAPDWNVVILRYFNPVGAHESGLIGEEPSGVPNNLMPYICRVASRRMDKLHVFGNDYDTPDGTGIRDYIHVVDLAKGHVSALKAIENNCGLGIYNLGTGNGYSVLQMVRTFEKVNGVSVPYIFDKRRSGDVAACWSDPTKANNELGWKAERSIEDMCKDAWRWEKTANSRKR